MAAMDKATKDKAAKWRRRAAVRGKSGRGKSIRAFERRAALARHTTAAAAAGTIAGVRFETIGTVWIAIDPDHRKDNNGRRLSIGIDISAAAPVARLVGKSDDFAHCSPLSAPT
ncbi:MAG: hypothetical protein WAM62_16000 [Pseudolabrys sp.]